MKIFQPPIQKDMLVTTLQKLLAQLNKRINLTILQFNLISLLCCRRVVTITGVIAAIIKGECQTGGVTVIVLAVDINSSRNIYSKDLKYFFPFNLQ